MKRKFRNRKFRGAEDAMLFISEDSYTENEMEVNISNLTMGISTCIKKEAMKQFASELKDGATDVFADKSDYYRGFVKAVKTETGYNILVKNVFTVSGDFPDYVITRIIEFIENLEQ